MLTLTNRELNNQLNDEFYDRCKLTKSSLSSYRLLYEETLYHCINDVGSVDDETIRQLKADLERLQSFFIHFVNDIEKSWNDSLDQERTAFTFEKDCRELDDKFDELALDFTPQYKLELFDFTLRIQQQIESCHPHFYDNLFKKYVAENPDYDWLLYTNELNQWQQVLQTSYPHSFQEWLLKSNLREHANLHTRNLNASKRAAKEYAETKLFEEITDEINEIFVKNESHSQALHHVQDLVSAFVDAHDDVLTEILLELRKEV